MSLVFKGHLGVMTSLGNRMEFPPSADLIPLPNMDIEISRGCLVIRVFVTYPTDLRLRTRSDDRRGGPDSAACYFTLTSTVLELVLPAAFVTRTQ
jgi:hypothetical protein